MKALEMTYKIEGKINSATFIIGAEHIEEELKIIRETLTNVDNIIKHFENTLEKENNMGKDIYRIAYLQGIFKVITKLKGEIK